MIRLCLIGNSHLAAFKNSCDEKALAKRGIKPTFFGSIRDSLQFIKVEGTRLVPTNARVSDSFKLTSGGLTEIDTADYDAFALIGLSISMKRVSRFYGAHRFFGQTPDPSLGLIRRHLAVAALTADFASSRLGTLGRTIRSVCDKPIFGMAEPFWGEGVLATRKGKGWAQIVKSGDAEGLAQLFNDAVDAAVAPFGTFLRQPNETVAHHVLSRAEFNVKDVWDNAPKPDAKTEPDFAHMNAAFGKVCWKPLVSQLTGRSAKSAAA